MVVFEHRQQVRVLAAQKILPEKIAGPEQLGEERQGLLLDDPGTPGPSSAPCAHAAFRVQQFVEKEIEMCNGFSRVRSEGQGVGELLDQGGGELEFLLFRLVRELLTLPVAYVKLVMDEQPAILDTRLVDVNVPHGQRVRQGIKKGRRVGRLYDHDRVGRGGLVIESDLHRLKQRREGPSAAAKHFYQTTVHPTPDFLKAGFVQQADQDAQFFDQVLLLLRPEADAVERPDAEKVNDFLAAQPWPSRAVASDPAAHRRDWGFSGLLKRVNQPFADVQPKGGEQAADGGKLRKVIVGDNRDGEQAIRVGRDLRVAGLQRRQAIGKREVCRHHVDRLLPEIVLVHPHDEVADDRSIDLRTTGLKALDHL